MPVRRLWKAAEQTKRKISSLRIGFGFQTLSLDFFPPFFLFFFPLLPFQPNIPLTFKYTNTQAEEKQCSQVEKILLCEKMQRISRWGGKHSLTLPPKTVSEAVVGFFMCVCMPSLLCPLPSRTSLLSPSGFRHSQPLATAVAQGSGITDSSSLVIQHLSEVQLSFPYVLIRCCFLPCRKDAQAGGCRSSAWSLSQPCSHQTSEGLSEEFSLWRWQGWVWEQKP